MSAMAGFNKWCRAPKVPLLALGVMLSRAGGGHITQALVIYITYIQVMDTPAYICNSNVRTQAVMELV